MSLHGTLTPALSRALAGEGAVYSHLLFPSPLGGEGQGEGEKKGFSYRLLLCNDATVSQIL
jgi:hypothetical protein